MNLNLVRSLTLSLLVAGGVGFNAITFAADSPAKQADGLYDTAKAQFDKGDATNAETLMRQSLEIEKTLKRPASLLRAESALASILIALNKSDQAKQLYQDALTVANEHKMIQEAISTTVNLGSLAMQQGQLDEASKLFQQALTDAQTNQMLPLESSALINLSMAERGQNHLNEAMSHLKEALPIIQKTGSDASVGQLYLEIGRVQADLNKVNDALESYRQAAEHFAQDFDTVSQGKAMLASGQLLLSKGQLTDAITKLTEAQTVLTSDQEIKGNGTIVDCLTSLAAAYTLQGRFDESEKTLSAAQALAKTLNPDKQREVLSESGYLSLVRGQPEQALEKYLAAYGLLPSQGENKIRAVLLTDTAMCYKALGQIDLAIGNYEKALAILTTAGDLPGQAIVANNLAVAYLDSGKMQDFDRLWHQASSLASADDKKGQATLFYNLAQSKLFHGLAGQAIPDYQKSLSLARAAADTTGSGQTLRGLGLAYLFNSQPAQAVDCYKEALKLAQQAGNSEAEWDCQLGLGKAFRQLGQKDQALTYLRQAADLAEKERVSLSRDTFKTFNLDLRQDCFYELVDLLIEENKPEEALEVAERSRARAFADLLANRQDTVAHRLNSATSTSSIDASPLPASFSFPQECSTASQSAAEALPVKELKQLVQNHGAACLEYYALPNKLVIWLIGADGTVHLLPPQALTAQQLGNKVAELYNTLIAQPKSLEEVKKSGLLRQTKLKEMYKLLVSPAEPYLTSVNHVIIVPHGPLFLVPFAALMNNQSKFFVESHTLSVAPAISILQSTATLADNSNSDNSLLAFGNPTTQAFAQLGSLPYAEKEVQKTAELFGKNTTIELGAQANRASFVQLAPKTSVIHMACHGIINEEHPTLSGLALAQDGKDNGFLSVKDILNLPPLKSRLVVLSACQTGRGKITGDGVIGLSRAFIAAGTPSVIVSHWNVDDVIAEFQMEEFYKTLLSGKNKAESLRQAQVKTITSMEGPNADLTAPGFIRANPRYWAAFQLIGEAR